MANIVFNISKGRAVELYIRVKNSDPANSGLILIPIETAGLEADAVLVDKETVADVLAGTTNEQPAMGRKTLTDAQLAAVPSPDHVNNRYDIALPNVTWTGATGAVISKMLVAYDPDTTAGSDTTLVPITMFDCALTPDGTDFQLTGATFFRAA